MTKRRPEVSPKSTPRKPGHAGKTDHTLADAAAPVTPQGLKRRHFMGTALALDAAALLAACGGGGGGGDSGSAGMSGSGSASGSSSASSSASNSGSASSSASGSVSSSGSSSSSGSGSGSAAPTNWVVTTFAGSGWANNTDGTGLAATFNTPIGIAVDTSGFVYVVDSAYGLIRLISPTGVVSTFAGSGGFGSINGTGRAASFDQAYNIALDATGNLFVSELTLSVIRKITPAGVTSFFAGGNVGFLDATGTSAKFLNPRGIAIDSSGTLFVADTSNHRIRKITPEGVVSTIVGTGAIGSADGIGTLASFNKPTGIAQDASGNLYVAEIGNHQIRKISPTGVVTTLAGSGTSGSANGTGTYASFNQPKGIVIDKNNSIFVADYGNHLIRKISSDGVVTTLAGSGARQFIDSTATLSGLFADGTSTIASFNFPNCIALDRNGNLFVSDTNNHRIRKITPIY